MKKGKFLEALRVAIMIIVLNRKGPQPLRRMATISGASNPNVILSYVEAHPDIFAIVNGTITVKRISLKKEGYLLPESENHINEILSFSEKAGLKAEDLLPAQFLRIYKGGDSSE